MDKVVVFDVEAVAFESGAVAFEKAVAFDIVETVVFKVVVLTFCTETEPDGSFDIEEKKILSCKTEFAGACSVDGIESFLFAVL